MYLQEKYLEFNSANGFIYNFRIFANTPTIGGYNTYNYTSGIYR